MKCEHCGRNISILSNYCEYCSKEVQSFGKRVVTKTKTIFDASVNLCKKKKWLLPVVLGIIAALIVVSIIANHEKKLNFTDYVSFEVSGYDGFGTLQVKFNYDELATEVLGKEPNPEVKKDYEKHIEYISDKEELMDLVAFRVDKTDGLKNGDFFLVTIYVKDNDIFEKSKISKPDEKYTKTFEIGADTDKLTELTEVNLLDYVTVEFSGENGNGKANISYEGFTIPVTPTNGEEYTLTLRYTQSMWGDSGFETTSSRDSDQYTMIKVSLDRKSNLRNGDTVKVTITASEYTLANQLGIKVSSTEKEYTVSGLE